MAWEVRTPFEEIELQFGLKENDIRKIMRREMKPSTSKMWRKRKSGIPPYITKTLITLSFTKKKSSVAAKYW